MVALPLSRESRLISSQDWKGNGLYYDDQKLGTIEILRSIIHSQLYCGTNCCTNWAFRGTYRFQPVVSFPPWPYSTFHQDRKSRSTSVTMAMGSSKASRSSFEVYQMVRVLIVDHQSLFRADTRNQSGVLNLTGPLHAGCKHELWTHVSDLHRPS